MRIALGTPAVIDLDGGTATWEASTGCCDLCRRDAVLYQLLRTNDALCEGCFVMWHG